MTTAAQRAAYRIEDECLSWDGGDEYGGNTHDAAAIIEEECIKPVIEAAREMKNLLNNILRKVDRRDLEDYRDIDSAIREAERVGI